MRTLITTQEIINNIVVLSLPYANNKEKLSSYELKTAYQLFLKSIQPYCPHITAKELFTAHPQIEKDFENYFSPELRIENIEYKENSQVMYPNPTQRKHVLENALSTIDNIDPEFVALFKLVMNIVFCTTSRRLGGTSVNPSYIGVMCAYYDMTADKKLLPELLIHEFSHNLMFLDEHRYGHYQNIAQLSDKRSYVDSEYDGQIIKLPFDRIFHRLIIFCELLQARNQYIGHHPHLRSQHLSTDEIIKTATWYLRQIADNSVIQNEIMTARSHYILKRVNNFIKHYQAVSLKA